MKKLKLVTLMIALMGISFGSYSSDPCIKEAKLGEAGTDLEGSCYDSGSSCTADICQNVIIKKEIG
ncbi:hypothetical protein [Marivirga sp.]|uniref:hypothetical protein n=1 Tax=Marivirga sp. TaxID=2018662 RepID=UPI003DA6D199